MCVSTIPLNVSMDCLFIQRLHLPEAPAATDSSRAAIPTFHGRSVTLFISGQLAPGLPIRSRSSQAAFRRRRKPWQRRKRPRSSERPSPCSTPCRSGRLGKTSRHSSGCLMWGRQSLPGDPRPLRPVPMPSKHHVPRLDPKLACLNLLIHRSRIERFGALAEEKIPPGKRVIQYAEERIRERKAARRAAKMFLAGKAGRVYTIRLNGRSRLAQSAGGSGAGFINHSCDPNLSRRQIRRQILLYSFRKIRAGEELTLDYGFQGSCPCRCGSSNRRGTMCHV
jgi:hypothetical protein